MNFEQQHGEPLKAASAEAASRPKPHTSTSGSLYYRMATTTDGPWQSALQGREWARAAELLDSMPRPVLLERLHAIEAAGNLAAITAAALASNRINVLGALRDFEPPPHRKHLK
jgi:hypothetical protein